MRRFAGKPFDMLPVGDCPAGDIGPLPAGDMPFCIRCWCNARALAMMLFSTEAPPLPAKLDDVDTGCLAIPKRPMAVEFGFMLGGSDTDRNDGILLGSSSGLS